MREIFDDKSAPAYRSARSEFTEFAINDTLASQLVARHGERVGNASRLPQPPSRRL
jgi:hypothetical protein